MPDPDDFETEGQDVAETFDEENITPDGRDIATPDLQRDVYDATRSDEDADEALNPDDDFDPDAMDEAEYEEVVQAEEDLDATLRAPAGDGADRVADDDDQPDDYEPDGPGEQLHDAEEAMAERVDRDLGHMPRGADDADPS